MNLKDLLRTIKENNIDISLNGQNLQLNADASIPDDLLAMIKDNKSALIDYLENADGSYSQIPKIDDRLVDYPVSSAQRRLWFLSQFDGANEAYNMYKVFHFHGPIDVQAFENALLLLVERHESLRTIFLNKSGDVRQMIISPQLGFRLSVNDQRGSADDDLHEKINRDVVSPFDLLNGPLVRSALYRTGESRWVFSFVLHHIVGDGWSMGVLLKELLTLYQSLADGKPHQLAPLAIQYKDYVSWRNTALQGGSLAILRDYWLNQFDGELPILDLPFARTRPVVKTYNGSEISRTIVERTAKPFSQLCRKEGATLFMGVVAAVKVLLFRYTGQNDIIVGTSVAGREHPDLDDQVGLYADTLPLRTKFEGQDTFVQVLQKVHQVAIGAFEHQAYPFDALVEALQLRHDAARHPLFDVAVVMPNARADYSPVGDLGDLTVKLYEGASNVVSKFDLTFYFKENGDDITVSAEFNTALFDEPMISRMLLHIEQLIASAVLSPSDPIYVLDYLNGDERDALLSFGFAEAPIIKASVVDLFEEQVRRNPDAIAVIFEGTQLTYGQLDVKAESLGLYLHTRHGVGAGDFVGIMIERSEKMIIAMLAAVKCGAAYVPIDPEYPQMRKTFILQDTAVKILITETAFLFDMDYHDGPVFAIDVQLDDLESATIPESLRPSETSLAYVMYTSGSTGNPKGVMVEHKGIVRLVKQTNYIDINDEDCILSLSNFVFDGSTFDVFGALLNGATLALTEKSVFLDISSLNNIIEKNNVTAFFITTAFFNTFADSKDFRPGSLKTVLFGGELVSVDHVSRFQAKYPAVNVVHVYGPTENTTFSTWYRVSDVSGQLTVPIGKPITNTTVYVLDQNLRLVPENVNGDIYVGGAGIARGYLNNDELTAKRFFSDPFMPEERIYKTGDVGRWLSSGDLEFIGRSDFQVKVRGHRIELGEVENAIRIHLPVSAVFVTTRKSQYGDIQLVAYLLSNDVLSKALIDAELSKVLPKYMLPHYYVSIPSLPLTLNGKVDKSRLPDPRLNEEAVGVEYAEPRNETEEILAKIWCDLLEVRGVGVKDNFFDIGGHSLKAIRLSSQIHKAFDIKVELKDLFSYPVLEDQARLIMDSARRTFVSIEPLAGQPHYMLSSSQRRLWVLSRFAAGNVAYNMPGAFVFSGTLNIDFFERAFLSLIERHEILRTVFNEDENGEVQQFIRGTSEIGFHLDCVDLRSAVDRDQIVRKALQEQFVQAFELSTGPLIRASLFRVESDRWVLGYAMHHIISDGWSMGILIRELLGFYNGFIEGAPLQLPALRIQYKDYARWQQEQLSGEKLLSHRRYWLDQFSGVLPVLELPTDRVRPPVKTYSGGIVYKELNSQLSESLKALCQREGCTLFMGLMAAVKVLLYRYTGQQDIIVGSPVAGRDHADLEDQIGFYVNTLAFRTRLSGEDSYRSLLGKVKGITLDGYEHQVYPFDELVHELNLQRDMSRSILFDVEVGLHNMKSKVDDKNSRMAALNIARYEDVQMPVSILDLIFNFYENEDHIELQLEFNSDLFDVTTVQRLSRNLEYVLERVAENPNIAIGEVAFVHPEEMAKIMTGFNQTAQVYEGETVLDFFRQQVRMVAEKPAVVFSTESISYRVLDEDSDKLAAYLVSVYGVERNACVGIMLDRSAKMITAIFAVLKAGATYVPIDPDYPEARKQFIVQDSDIKVLITQTDYMFDFPYFSGRLFAIDVQLDLIDDSTGGHSIDVSGEDHAYVIYTSGTTGTPKGVLVSHRNLFYSTAPRKDIYYAEQGAFLLLSSISFDSSIAGIFGTLSFGGTLHIPDKNLVASVERIGALIVENAITHLLTVPSYYRLLLEHIGDQASELRNVILAGEYCPRQIIDTHYDSPALRQCELFNEYGPTECTVWSTFYNYSKSGIRDTIGRPIPNAEIFVLDDASRFVPIGVFGEIYIGGPGVSSGYLKNRPLNSQKFVQHPLDANRGVYKTGDVARWTHDGFLEFLGRRDDQLKIRGYRIELGEIEYALEKIRGIRGAAVTSVEMDGDKLLVAYLISEEPIDRDAIAAALETSLPAYMVPAHYVAVGNFPLTPNGKVDKKKLPLPNVASTGHENGSPRTSIEERLVAIWQEVLGHAQVGIYDNFFKLGGHSLKITRLATRIQKIFGVKVDFIELFARPVLEQQAQLITDTTREHTGIRPVAEAPHYPLSSSQRRLWVLNQFDPVGTAYNIPGVYLLVGDLHVASFERAFSSLIERHEALRTVFRESESGEVRQFVLSAFEVEFGVEYMDVRSIADAESVVRNEVRQEFGHVFDLSSSPLLRVRLFQMDAGHWVFSYVMHHIISDGWSMRILVSELLRFYNSYSQRVSVGLKPLQIQYKDYAVWQLEQAQNKTHEQHRQYWLDRLTGELPILDLPTDRIRPSVKTYRGGIVNKQIGAELTESLKALCAAEGSTVFMGLLAAVKALLFRYTGQEDIIVGSPIAGRDHMDLEDQIGFYVNTLALRTRFSGKDTYRTLLSRVKEVTLGGYDHQAYPFDQLLDDLDLTRDMSRSALFDILVDLDDKQTSGFVPGGTMANLEIRSYPHAAHTVSKFDLTFYFIHADSGLELLLEYNTDLFNSQTACRFVEHFTNLLNGLIGDLDAPIHTVSYMNSVELRQLRDLNQPIDLSVNTSIIAQLEKAAIRHPDAPAIIFENQRLTYSELRSKSNQLANYLIDRYHVNGGDRIGVYLDRSDNLIITLLAILKSGGAYVPIEPDNPEARKELILNSAQPKVVITQTEYLFGLSFYNGPIFAVDVQLSELDTSPILPIKARDPDDPAYVIYTSGSTGIPKGCVISHSALGNYVKSANDFYFSQGYTPNFPLFTSVGFDLTVTSIYCTLTLGGTLEIFPQHFDLVQVMTSCLSSGLVNTMKLTPSHVRVMNGMGISSAKLGKVILGGEALSADHVSILQKVNPNIEIYNEYGPTETTVGCTVSRVYTPAVISIGKPFANAAVYVLDGFGNEVSVGVVGEICISGPGLALGYFDDDILTQQKFVDNSVTKIGKMYKTGDLGRWQSDGTLQFLGRKDDQVKIRGYRVDISEINAILDEIDDVESSLVVTGFDKGGDIELVCYLMGVAINISQVKQLLSKRLPLYMIPQHFVHLEKFPLTTNGKIDRKKLPDYKKKSSVTVDVIAPRNRIEEQLVDLWKDVLARDVIGVGDNFFELGGHSLKAVQVLSRVNAIFSVQISMNTIFQSPTIEELAQQIAFVQDQARLRDGKAGLVEIEL